MKNIFQIDDKRTYEFINVYENILKDFGNLMITNVIYKTVIGTEAAFGSHNCF